MKRMMLACAIVFMCLGMIGAKGSTEQTPPQVVEVSCFATQEDQVAIYGKVFQDLVDSYNAEHGTAYTLVYTPGQGMDITNTRMSSNSKPDIFTLDSPADVNQYARDGLLLDLTAGAKADGWDKTLFGWAFDLAKVDGKVVTLPYGYEGMVLWYNKTLMRNLGLNPADIRTLADYETALSKAAQADLIPVMLGSQDWPWAQEWYLSILYSYTGRQLLRDTITGASPTGWTDPAFKTTVELYKSWHDRKWLADGRSYVLTSDDAINAFTNGLALFKLEGTWAPYWILPLEEAERANIGVMLHPSINTDEEPHLPLAVGGMWCASADTKHPQIVQHLLNGLLAQDIQSEFVQNGMDVAPMQIDPSEFKGLDPTIEQMWAMVNTALAEGSFGYTTWAFYPPETRVYLYEGIVNVLEGRITVDAYLTELDRLNKKELAQGFSPVLPQAR